MNEDVAPVVEPVILPHWVREVSARLPYQAPTEAR